MLQPGGYEKNRCIMLFLYSPGGSTILRGGLRSLTALLVAIPDVF